MVADKQIFLSHASADKALADLLRNTLILGGVAEERIFYSSDRGTGIPSGQDVGSYLRQTLQRAGLVIELISETFLTRPMCLMELGGAWTLDLSTYPIVVPPLSRDEVTRQIGNFQMGELGNPDQIDAVFYELHDRLDQDLGIGTRIVSWNRAINDFKRQLPETLLAGKTAEAAAEDAAAEAAARLAARTARRADAGAANPLTARATRRAAPPLRQDPVIVIEGSNDDTITISNVSLVAGISGKELTGEVTNHDGVEHTTSIMVTCYDAEGRISGTADAMVTQMGPGRTKTFNTHRVPDFVRAKVAVDLVL